MTESPLLTSDEVAERLRVETVTVRRWAASGKIPCGRLPNGDYRFDWREILTSIFPAHGTSGGQGHPEPAAESA